MDYYLRVILSLLVVLVVMYLFSRYMKSRIRSKEGLIEMLQFYSFGRKNGIALFKIFDEVFLLGISEANVTLLHRKKAADVLTNFTDMEKKE